MAVKASKKDVILNAVYSLGAAVVIFGALLKINHWSIFGLDGSWVLGIGLIVEAFIFVVFAFDPPVGEYEWEKAYPALAGGDAMARAGAAAPVVSSFDQALDQSYITKRIDEMLKGANFDVELVNSLKQNFEKLNTAVDALGESTGEAKNVSDQLSTLSNNLSSLNRVYGGMLSVMKDTNG